LFFFAAILVLGRIAAAETAKDLAKQGDAAADEGNLALARKHYERAIQAEPDWDHTFRVHIMLGKIAYAEGHPQEAVQQLAKAIALNPADPEAYMMLGVLLPEMGKNEKALAVLDAAVKRIPKHALLRNMRASLLMNKFGRADEAFEEFGKVKELDPTVIHSYMNRGLILIKQGRFKEAIPELEAARKIDPQNYVAAHQLGGAYLDSGRLDEALATLREARLLVPKERIPIETGLKFKPNRAEAAILTDMGLTFLDMKNEKDAEACFKWAIERYRALRQAHGHLCLLLVRQGRKKDATETIATALTLFPDDRAFLDLQKKAAALEADQ
jgi:tetratricopeptide (TPR) repeat protein